MDRQVTSREKQMNIKDKRTIHREKQTCITDRQAKTEINKSKNLLQIEEKNPQEKVQRESELHNWQTR